MGIGSSIAHQRDVRANVANLDSMHSASHFSGGQLAMTGFDQGVLEFQHTQDRLNGIVVTVWIVHLLVAGAGRAALMRKRRWHLRWDWRKRICFRPASSASRKPIG